MLGSGHTDVDDREAVVPRFHAQRRNFFLQLLLVTKDNGAVVIFLVVVHQVDEQADALPEQGADLLTGAADCGGPVKTDSELR